MPPRLVQLGVIGAPHGVRGELRVKSFTADPKALAGYRPLTDAAGTKSFEIASARPIKDDMLVVRFKSVGTREAAAALTGVGLYAPREALPPAEDDDEFYHADLIGLRAETADAGLVGEITAMQNFGADDLLEIKLAGERRTIYLPFTKAVAPIVDIAGGRVVVDPPEGALDAPGKDEPEG
ncbi:ribosome maturation factor RimM [Hansschlegelia quercus]|uniref:Ribosome maturation factor RimM n=1 Tax=Hansschlegelia quercus TaxID=2528245 RepID=A0A4Q9G9Y6_9HYPH|nr:ribosome maturation factor RimM [Hansschlegelia quercus]TBN47610.1 ribosome maturation factor RimM [Hansschlegelia quercus]